MDSPLGSQGRLAVCSRLVNVCRRVPPPAGSQLFAVSRRRLMLWSLDAEACRHPPPTTGSAILAGQRDLKGCFNRDIDIDVCAEVDATTSKDWVLAV